MTATPARERVGSPGTTSNGGLQRLILHSGQYMIGVAVSLLLGFVSFPIFTRAFPVAEYGFIDLVQKALLLGVATSKLGLQNSALRFHEPNARYYSTFFFGVSGTASMVSGVFLLVASAVLAPKYPGLQNTLWIIALLMWVRPLASITLSFFRAEERPAAYNAGLIATKAGIIAAVYLLLKVYGPTLKAFLAGSLVVETTLILIYAGSFVRRGLLRLDSFQMDRFRAALLFGMPLIAYELATIILDSGDRLLVQYFLGAEPLGRYSVAYGLSSYLNDLVVTPLRLAVIPIYVKMWAAEGSATTSTFLTKGLAGLVAISALLLPLAAVTAKDGIHILASSKYDGVAGLIPWVVGGLLIYTTHVFIGAGLLLAKKTVAMAGALLVAAVSNIALNCVLIPAMGLEGAAISTFLSYVVCIVVLWRSSSAVLPVKIPWALLLRYCVCGAMAWFAGALVNPENVYLRLAARAIVTVLFYTGALLLVDAEIRQFVQRLGRRFSPTVS